MGDLGGFGMRRQPTTAEVVGRLKDDGDFDALRRTVVRTVKDNVYSYFGTMYPMEGLRNNIITEVKQSMVLNEDGLEKLKLKELSDAIYQDIGSKIMGQISDEVWSAIQSNETDIRGTVERVYNRIMNPEQQQYNAPSSNKLKGSSKEEQVSPAKASTCVTAKLEDDPEEPPGFGFSDHQRSNMAVTQQQPSNAENNNQLRPNVGEPVVAVSLGDGDEEDPDVPPGFG